MEPQKYPWVKWWRWRGYKKGYKPQQAYSFTEKKTNNKPAPKLNRQPSVEDMDDPADNLPRVHPRNPRNILESDEDDDDKTSNFPATSWATSQDIDGDEDGEEEMEVVEQPAESAEAELSE